MVPSLPIGVQVYSVRDDAERDFKGTMKALKEMGYDGVELAGLYGMEPRKVREILDEVGIPAISAHVPIVELKADPEGVLRTYREVIGCQYVAFPYLPAEMRYGTPAFADTMATLKQICEAAKKAGVTMLYHNHDFEFTRMEDGRYFFDYLYETIPADLLQTEIDTCWVNVAGEDPAACIRKYAGRCPLVHLKDFYKEGRPENMYQLIGVKDDAAQRGVFEFRPCGMGLQDMPALVKASEESGAKWLIVEQDSSNGRTPLEAVRLSVEYLKNM